MVVDTGADLSVLDAKVADELGLWDFPVTSQTVRGISGPPEQRMLYGTIVELAGLEVAITVDCRHGLSENILGRDVINEFELIVCAKENLVRFKRLT